MVVGNADEIEQFLHPDLRFVHVSGVKEGRDDYLARFWDGRLVYRTLVSTEIDIEVCGETVLLWSDLEADVVTPKGDRAIRNRCLTVWSVVGETPRLLAYQPTVVS